MDSEQELIIRASWLYYFEGLNQERVAERLGIKRIKVVRLLKEAMNRGFVEIRINPEKFSLFGIEERLKEVTGLGEVIVVPTTAKLFESLSSGAAHAINKLDQPEGNLGIGMGRTLQGFSRYLDPRKNRFTAIVTLCGNANPNLSITPYSIGFDSSKKLGIDFFNIWAPLVIDSSKDAITFREDRFISSVLQMAQDVQTAVVGIGSLEDSSLIRMGYISEQELAQVSRSDVAGEILGSFFSLSGEKIRTSIDERLIAVDFPMNCPVIGVAGGKNKILPIVGAIRTKYIDTLVTDEETANAVIAVFEND